MSEFEAKPAIFGIVTRHRPDDVRRCVTSAIATAGAPMRIAILYDDDPVSFDMCPRWPYAQAINVTPRHYYVRGKNRMYQLAKEMAGDAEYFVMSNDDSEWLRPDWLSSAQEALEKQFEDGMGIIEMFMSGHCAHWISKFKFIDEYLNGKLGDPRFTMYFSDTDMMLRTAGMDRYASIVPSGTMRDQYHNRIVAHKMAATADRTAYEVQSGWWEHDQAIFNELWPDHGKEDEDKCEDPPQD